MTDSTRPIPQALYPCEYCADEYSWPADDLYWSEIDQAWVCDACWSDRDSAWTGDGYIDEPRNICLADDIKNAEDK